MAFEMQLGAAGIAHRLVQIPNRFWDSSVGLFFCYGWIIGFASALQCWLAPPIIWQGKYAGLSDLFDIESKEI